MFLPAPSPGKHDLGIWLAFQKGFPFGVMLNMYRYNLANAADTDVTKGRWMLSGA
jgi:hypothetical protein